MNAYNGAQVEIYNLDSARTCSLSNLPNGESRSGHTRCGGLLCGDADWNSALEKSCLKLNPLTGNFTATSVSLVEARSDHLCWELGGAGGEILLMGGPAQERSTELVSLDGSSSANFTLKYSIK